MVNRLWHGDQASGDDVGCDLVFNECDPVAQLQLAFFQTLKLKQIGRWQSLQRSDGGIKITMLLLQPNEFGLEFAVFVVVHDALNLRS